MDLYRTLRVSLYLLAGTGAFAISVAERSFFYLGLIAVLGVASFLTIDRGKAKPISAEVTAGLTLLLLYLALRPLHDDDHWQANFPAAVAHFLCAWQGLLFFSVYGGPVLLTYCGSTLAVVVMSGVVQSGPSLVARVTCFLAVAVWTLYIHAVWRSRQEFAGLSTILHGVEEKRRGDRAVADPFKRLPEGAFWSTLTLVLGMTAACIALGVATFFSVPRVDGVMAFFDKHNSAPRSPNDTALIPAGGTDQGLAPLSGPGISDAVRLKDLGRIPLDPHIALRATFSKPAALLADKQNRILFKGQNLAAYSDGVWLPDSTHETLESKGAAQIAVRDPSLDGSVKRGEELQQTIEIVALNTADLFAAGPVARVNERQIERDGEGSIRSVDGANFERYAMTVTVPFDAVKLPDNARADHRDVQRYILQNGLASEHEAVAQLARQITRRSANDAAKARDIQAWLETHRTYTRNLERIHPAGDPTAHFLLTADPEQARGHCGLFASAFVMLCRFNNMPARLCTGFAGRIIGQTNGAAAGQSRTAEATKSDAHAWAEVYFKNIGWVPFDPTPAETDSSADTEPRVAQTRIYHKPADGTAGPSSDSPVEPAASKGFIQDAWNAMLSYNGYEQRKLYERFSGTTGSSRGFFTSGGWGAWLGIAFAWIGIAVAIGWLVQLFARRNGRRKYTHAIGGMRARAAVAFYNDLLQALSKRGFSRRPGQTPREFAESVLRRGGEAYAPVREVTAIFETVRYGGGELEQDEFNRLQDALDRIREMTF